MLGERVMRWLLAVDIAVPTLGADVVGSRLPQVELELLPTSVIRPANGERVVIPRNGEPVDARHPAGVCSLGWFLLLPSQDPAEAHTPWGCWA
jgi:hypothetical protein